MTTDMYVVGIDPGLSGAIAWVEWGGPMYRTADMPVMDGRVNATALADLLTSEETPPMFAVVEQVSSMPGQGVASTFKFGTAYGAALGVLGALEIPIVHVRPNRWKKDFGIGSDKEKGRALAIDRWPNMASELARKKDHGRAEAGLIAQWGIDNR